MSSSKVNQEEKSSYTDRIVYYRRKIVVVMALLSPLAMYGAVISSINSMAPDKPIETFIESCSIDSQKCVQLGPTYFRSQGLNELRFSAPLSEVESASFRWIESQSRTEIIFDAPDLTHAVFVTSFWRFRDDFLVQVLCDGDDTIIWVHSTSRLGVNDLGVNFARVEKFHKHMNSQTFSDGSCR